MSRFVRICAFGLVIAGTVSSCVDDPTDALPNLNQADTEAAAMTVAAPSGNQALNVQYEELAKALAVGLGDRSVRMSLLEAMKTSRWSEHKIDLHTWWSQDGHAVWAAIKAPEVAVEELDSVLTRLPSSDLYVVGRAARTTWKGDTPPAVAGLADPDVPEVIAWTAGGGSRYVRVANIAADPIIVVHPAEARGERLDVLPLRAEIQSPDERDIGIDRSTRPRSQGEQTAAASRLSGERHSAFRNASSDIPRSTPKAHESALLDTYDYNVHGYSFVTSSEQVNEIGGAEVRISGYGQFEADFRITGVERNEISQFDELAGAIPGAWADGYYQCNPPGSGHTFVEEDPFDDDEIGATLPNTCQEEDIVIWVPLWEQYVTVGEYVFGSADPAALPPVIESYQTLTLARGESAGVAISGNYFMSGDGLAASDSGLGLTNPTRQGVTSWTATVTAASNATPGYASISIARAGTGLSAEATDIIQVLPPLSASVSGPSIISHKGTYQWTVSASGARSPYSYQWVKYDPVAVDSTYAGTSATQSAVVSPGDLFEWHVTVTSTNNEVVTEIFAVGGDIETQTLSPFRP